MVTYLNNELVSYVEFDKIRMEKRGLPILTHYVKCNGFGQFKIAFHSKSRTHFLKQLFIVHTHTHTRTFVTVFEQITFRKSFTPRSTQYNKGKENPESEEGRISKHFQ